MTFLFKFAPYETQLIFVSNLDVQNQNNSYNYEKKKNRRIFLK